MRRFHGAIILTAIFLAAPAFGQNGTNRDDLPILLRQQLLPRTFIPTFRAPPGTLMISVSFLANMLYGYLISRNYENDERRQPQDQTADHKQ